MAPVWWKTVEILFELMLPQASDLKTVAIIQHSHALQQCR